MINAAPPGGTVNIPAGTYKEGAVIIIDKDLTLQRAGASSTVLDGIGSNRVIRILSGATVAINGITVQNGINIDRADPPGNGSRTVPAFCATAA
jgi:hypothetical protein